MKSRQISLPVAVAFALLLVTTTTFFPSVSWSQAAKAQPQITIAGLAGPWQLVLVGNTGCGTTSILFTGTLNSSGVATGTLTGSSGCGVTSTTQTFTINSLNANGSGTANLTCGSGCGWDLTIQVNPARNVMNLVDVSASNPGNYIAGTAVKQ